MRSRVYEAAVLIVTEDYDGGVTALTDIDKTGLDARDAELLEAARCRGRRDQAARRARRRHFAAGGYGRRHERRSATKLKSVELAQKAMARVDALLAGVRQ